MNFNNNFFSRFLLLAGALAAAPASGAGQWQLCRPWPIAPLPPTTAASDETLVMSADGAELRDQQAVTLEGNVVIEGKAKQLRADQARYDQSSGELEAFGNIRYDGDNFTALSSEADIDVERNRGVLKDTRYFFYDRHTRGASDALYLEGEALTILKGASITTCDPGSNDWAIKGSTVKLNHSAGVGSVYNARVSFQGVPFLYLPYLRFPITGERTSGLLVPSFGSSNRSGNELALPFYWNIHPQLDATITPHNYTSRGLKWETELRYLSHLGEGTITAQWIDDKAYGGERQFFGFSHGGDLGGGWSSDINYSRLSDGDYFADFGNALSTTAKTHIERHAKLNYRFGQGSLALQVQDYQTLDETIPESSRPYRRLPQLTFDYQQEASDLGLNYALESEWVRFQRQDRVNGSRLDLLPSLSYPYERSAGFITPKVSARYTRYRLDDQPSGADNAPLRTLPWFSLDSGIFLERDSHLFGQALIQTLEPRLFYLYVPYRDQSELPLFDTGQSKFSMAQLFTENRFNGADRVGDANQLSLALTSRLLESDSGRERLSATVGQIFYFHDRRVALRGEELDQRPRSDIVVEAKLTLGDHINISTELLWDSEYELLSKKYFKLQYKNGNSKIINMSYRYQGNPETAPDKLSREVDLSAVWPINPSWSIIGRRYYSLEDDRTLENLAGVEYNSCCWALRLVKRDLFSGNGATASDEGELQRSWMAQLELKGLTSIGRRIEEMMSQSIAGYSSVP